VTDLDKLLQKLQGDPMTAATHRRLLGLPEPKPQTCMYVDRLEGDDPDRGCCSP